MKSNKSMFTINLISFVIVGVVAVLLLTPQKFALGEWTKSLPHLNGAINTLTSILLITGFILIKKKLVKFHRAAMTTAFLLGFCFLIFYVLYHISNPPTKFGGIGWERLLYFLILISHIGLSLVVLPLVLRAAYFAYLRDFESHKKIARFAFPIWLYVSVTGVIAYLMIRQYY